MQTASGQSNTDTTVTPIDSFPAAVTDTQAQMPDLPAMEIASDSVSKKPWQFADWDIDWWLPLASQVLKRHPYYSYNSDPVVILTGLKTFYGKETLFYALTGLLLAFALLKQSFPKYFNDLFSLLFRTTLKQKQIREQLMQTPLPSFLLNIFFAVSGGLYIDILMQHFDKAPVENFWLLFLYCALGLSIIYSVKFAGLKISGWLFNMREAADNYIFIVFLINKVIGIFLLPFLLLLSFTKGNVYQVTLVLSWCGVAVLYIYRFLLTYATVRNQVRFNPFHFFLYLVAFEAAPLLLIYKALLFFFP
ncbi:MAG: DUF4271 domain-containing protein [Chitinophagaceae bacterium]|nr:DUF4271 domain-containing protein [Chitinophagaceae bacterium]